MAGSVSARLCGLGTPYQWQRPGCAGPQWLPWSMLEGTCVGSTSPASSSCISTMPSERMHRGPRGLDDEVGGAAVQRVALAVQLAQARQRVGHLQQRPVGVVAQAAEAGLPPCCAGRPHGCANAAHRGSKAAARRRRRWPAPALLLRQFVDDVLFDVTEGGFALGFEKGRGSACRSGARSRCRCRRTSGPAGVPGGGRPSTCHCRACRRGRWSGGSICPCAPVVPDRSAAA